MNASTQSLRVKSRRVWQSFAWAVAGLFILGFFLQPIGMWTGPILGVWFAGTQKPLRGFLWLMAFAFVPSMIADWRIFTSGNAQGAFTSVGWILVASILAVLPLTFYRVVSQGLPGWLSTLPFPVAAAAMQMLTLALLPSSGWAFLARDPHADLPLLKVAASLGFGSVPVALWGVAFLRNWIVAGIVWMWNNEFRAARIRAAAPLFGILAVVWIAIEVLTSRVSGIALPEGLPIYAALPWVSYCGVIVLSLWALVRSWNRRWWTEREETLGILESPDSGECLKAIREGRNELLVSSRGERFPISNGIPVILRPEDLTGQNLKYNHLYETIGGMYDDSQRVICALSGFDRDEYVMSYLGFLEVKAGDRVLETSVGTGLNFKYLPRGIKLFGLDLSPEMLVNCQANMRRWGLDADLFLGNAERLPFADSSFDVVFHVGGINFFNDRAAAILEMIRVARPGSRILIADETEEHVKSSFEKFPVTGDLYKNRAEQVVAPVDLVPSEMEEIHLEILNVVGKNRFYALTFRKPSFAGPVPRETEIARALQ